MDTSQNDTNTKQKLAVLEDTAEAATADIISETNAFEDDITENHVSENTISEESPTNTDDELFKKIDELNDALDDIDIARRILYEQRTALDQQVKLQEQEKRNRQKSFSRLKLRNIFLVFLFNFFMICVMILSFGIFQLFEQTNYINNKYTLDFDYDEQISVLDTAIDNLTQEKDNLIQQTAALQNTLARQEQASQAATQKEHILSQDERSDTINTILTEDTRQELDAYIASLKRYPSLRVAQKQFDGISYYEVVQKYDMEQYMLSDSGNSTIYPGAILRGDSLMQGTTNYTLISQDRAPITLVCSHDGSSVQLENVSYGTVKEAVEQLWNESNREYAEKWDYSIRSVQNEESLNLSLGISMNSAKLGLGISHAETSSSMAIIFTETYFSVSAEPLKSATQYFQSGCDLKSLGEYEPAYVSSVDYGRRIVVLVTTEMSESELKANLGANISGIDIGADLSYIKKEIDSGCKICCYGGDSAKTLQAIDNNEASGGLKGWWDELINGKANDASGFNQMIATDDSLANPVPLTYRLNYLSDNSSVPAVAILNDDIVLAETARLVTLTLEGNLPGTFRLSDSAGAIGYVVNTDQIQITEKGETSGEIQFIWDSSTSAPLTGFFKDSQVSYSLAEISEEADSPYNLATEKGLFSSKSTDLHIYISDAVYEIP